MREMSDKDDPRVHDSKTEEVAEDMFILHVIQVFY